MIEKGKISFLIEKIFFKTREMLSHPETKLAEAGIMQGWRVLDFGCGIGSYSIAAAGMVGKQGLVYALDCQPLAVKHVKNLAVSKGLSNVQTILTECDTGLESGTIDAILLYDVFHDLKEPGEILKELTRILKKEGILSFSDHHLKKTQIMSEITEKYKFRLVNEGRLTYTFSIPEKLL